MIRLARSPLRGMGIATHLGGVPRTGDAVAGHAGMLCDQVFIRSAAGGVNCPFRIGIAGPQALASGLISGSA